MEELKKQRRKAQALRRGQTKEESHLWYDFLKTYPVQFRRQYQIGPYYVDFYCYQASLAIELDGSQHYDPDGMIADEKRTRFLQEQGLTVLRFSNLDIWKNFSGVKETIDAQVKARLKIEG